MNYYTVLGVDPQDSNDTIREKYMNIISVYHPDKNPDDPDATEKFIQINEAFEVLSNPIKKSEYDESRNSTNNDFFTMRQDFQKFLEENDIPIPDDINIEDKSIFEDEPQEYSDVNEQLSKLIKEREELATIEIDKNIIDPDNLDKHKFNKLFEIAKNKFLTDPSVFLTQEVLSQQDLDQLVKSAGLESIITPTKEDIALEKTKFKEDALKELKERAEFDEELQKKYHSNDGLKFEGEEETEFDIDGIDDQEVDDLSAF